MILTSLDLDHFRNYESLHLSLDPGITIFFGDNAQGKTNLLEAVSLLTTGRSHRSSRDREMIAFGAEECHLKLEALKGETEIRIDMHLKNGRNKGVAVNRVPVSRTADYIGLVHTVFFSPEDLQIVKMGPSERRRFLDTELCLLDKIYLNHYRSYRRVLEQRNQLLKDISFTPSLQDTLEIWDEQLIRYGTEIINRRKAFIDELYRIVMPVHDGITGGREKLEIFYEPDTEAEDFEKNLKASLDRDIHAKTTGVGPHRDDLKFLLTDDKPIDARIYGSQGQQRTCALSLKLAEISLVEKLTGEKPVLLLDDVLSELDAGRQQYLLSGIRDVQTFITCTGLDDFVDQQLEKASVYQVEKGTVTKR